MIRCVALVGLLIAGLTTEAGSLEERVHAYVEQSRQTQGIAVALLTPGEVTRAVSGWAGPDRAVNKETLFEIGSVTKVFTGLLLAQLNEDGVVSLNSTVGELMPGPWELDPEVASIRLRELATHTSGLPRLPVNAGMLWRQLSSPADPYAGLNRDDVFSDVATLEASDLASRGEFAYAKLGPALLGRLLGTVTAESYETMIKTRVLAPLGLEDTAFTDTVLDDPRLAKPHRENLRPARNWRLDGYNPAGGLSSNLEDMIAFLQKAMTARAGTSLAKSMTEHWTRENGERGAGLGWVINERDDDRMVWHNGRTGGYYAFIGFLPDRNRGVVMLSNTSHSGDGFAVSLLRGNESPPAPERDWFFLGLTILLVPLAPFVAHGFRRRARCTLDNTATKPADRLQFLVTIIELVFVIALVWKIGVWNMVPIAYWWAGLLVTLGLLVGVWPYVVRLPWWPRLSKGRFALRLLGLGGMLVLMFWAIFLL